MKLDLGGLNNGLQRYIINDSDLQTPVEIPHLRPHPGIAHLPRREQPSNQVGPGTPRPSFAALRQGMRMGSNSPERHDFGPAYHSREGRVIKGRSLYMHANCSGLPARTG